MFFHYTDWTSYSPTVTLVGGTGNTVPQYTTNTGVYCRIGNVVMVEVLLDVPTGNNGAGTGQINIALPLQASASSVDDYRPGGHFHNGTTEHLAWVQIGASATTAMLFIQTSDTQTSAATGADQNNASNRTIRLSFRYRPA